MDVASLGQSALIGLFSHMLFIYFAWKLLSCINYEQFVRKGRTKELEILILFVAIVIGTGVSRFLLEIIQWSGDLVYLF